MMKTAVLATAAALITALAACSDASFVEADHDAETHTENEDGYAIHGQVYSP
jgi:hypothetical protein